MPPLRRLPICGAHLFSGGSMASALCTQSSQKGATSLSLMPAPA